MSMKRMLETLLERWLRSSQRMTAGSPVDHAERPSDADCLLSSNSMTGDLSEGRSRLCLPERRASDRVTDRSSLLAIGQDIKGQPLSEMATIHDVSLGGISFFLAGPVAVGQVLDLTLCSPEPGGLQGSAIFRIQAVVLRSSLPSCSVPPCLVAAEFKGEFVILDGAFDVDIVADELRKAVQFDEGRRSIIF
jgi:hypothetical protein